MTIRTKTEPLCHTAPTPTPPAGGNAVAPDPAVGVDLRTRAALTILCLGAFVVVLDVTIVNIAIPSIMGGLHSGLDGALWVLNAYSLAYAGLLITGGRLGDLYGPRRLLLIGTAIFTGASLVCAVAPSVELLVAARVLQGIGGALLTPQTLALIPVIMPPHRRGQAIGIWSGSAGLAAAIGPSLGGILVSTAGWRAIFLVNLPLGAVAAAGALAFLPGIVPGRRHRLDAGGIVLATGGLVAVVFGLVEGQRFQWGAIAGPISIPLVIAVGALLLVGFVVWERRQPEPLMPPALFSRRSFSVSAWVLFVFQTVMLAFVVVAGIYLQSGLGLTALAAGIALAPMPLSIMLVGPLAGRASDLIDVRYILMGAMLTAGAGVAWLIFSATPTAVPSMFIAPLVLTGLGLGCGFAVVMTVGMRGIAPQVAGAASGVLNTCRQVGAAMGGAIAVAVLQNRAAASIATHSGAGAAAFTGAFRATLVVPVALLILAALSCLLLPGTGSGEGRPQSQPGETDEAPVGGDPGRAVLHGQCCEVRIGDHISARSDLPA